MRLLYFINSITNSGGMERIVIDKINYQADSQDYQVSLAFYGQASDVPFFPINKKVRLLQMDEGTGISGFSAKIASISHVRREVKRVINEAEPDVIVNANMILVSWILPFVYRDIPKVVELHFSYEGMKIINKELYGDNRLKSWFNDALRRIFYAWYDRCVVLTEEDRRDWGFKNIAVIPNFTNVVPKGKPYSIDSKVAVNVGRFSPPKNQKLLLEAWGIIHQKVPDWQLQIWGDGEFRDDLTRQISELGLQDVVLLMGRTHDVASVYQQASFFVLSSRYEGQPLVMIEALSCGLPCVCTSVNGVRGVIENGYNGYIIPSMTPESLAEGILKMIGNDEKKKSQISQNAQESAKAFEKEVIMRRWTDLFTQLLKDKKNG